MDALIVSIQMVLVGRIILSVGIFGGSMSSDCFGGFIDQITTRKISTGNLQIGMALSIKEKNYGI
jgi:hypothetical protein